MRFMAELIGGYAIPRINFSKEEAIEHTRRFPQVHMDVLGPAYEGECEVAKRRGLACSYGRLRGWVMRT